MKRMQDRENSPRSKRSRSGYPGLDHESSRDRMSPDMDRRDSRGREPKPKPYRDFDHDIGPMSRGNKYHDRMGDGFGPARSEVRGPEYRSLCLSNISSKIPDAVLKDNLYHEFKKFGEFNVNVTFTGDQRVAYINFRYPEDARAAKHAKSKLIVFDRPVRVDPVFHRRRSSSPNNDMGRDYGGPSKGGYGHNSPPMQYGGRGGEGMGRGGANRRQNMGRGYISNQDNMPPPMSTSMERDNFDPQFQKDGASRKAPNEKFPYHLDHINPEDDIKATRTLFVGNLDYNIDLMELRQIFERFGAIEDIDVKRPQRGQGNAYAFLKYMNLDCAHQAKVEMSGQYIGRFQCKIGYGKVTPTTCLWVGGLGPWVTHQALEREFDRFGVIDRIEWPHGKTFAYVLYDNIDAATAACQEMRGFPFGDLNRRLRVDFADISHIISSPRPNDPPSPDGRDVSRNPQWRPPYDGPAGEHRDDWPLDDRGPSQRNSDPRDNSQGHRGRDVWEGGDRSRRPRTPDEFIDRQHKRSKSQEDKYDPKDRDVGRNRDNGRRPMHSQERDFSDGDRGDSRRFDERRISQGDKETEKALETVETVADMSKCLPAAWNGALILKSSAFPARMHVVGGNVTLVDNMMRDPSTTETPVLKVKQRLRLDQPKLEDVGRRVTGAGPRGHCILLALSGSLPHYEDTSVQQRPLKNLVTYLRQKDAAGVISLPNYDSKDKDNVGVLYAFPPCQFGYDYLMTKAPRLPPEPAVQDDYMVIVVIRGAA